MTPFFASAASSFLLDTGRQLAFGSAMMSQLQQITNAAAPITYPPFAEALKCYYQGKISWDALKRAAAWAGFLLPETNIPVSPNNDAGYRCNFWRKIVQSGTPVPDLDIFRTWALRNNNHMGLFESHMRHYGIDPETYKNIMLYVPNPPTIVQAQDMLTRGHIDANEFDRMMQAYGFGNYQDRQNLNKLRLVMPGPSDLVRFGVREVWNQQVVDRFGYDGDFPPEFQHWMEKSGMGWTPGVDTIQGPQGISIPWPQAYWRSHWEVMSPSQSYMAVHRLRPIEAGSTQSRVPGIRAFTEADLDLILKVHDYPAPMREWLKGLTYAIYTRVDIRRMLFLGLLTQAEAIEAYRDLGYPLDKAQKLTQFAVRNNAESVNRSTTTRLKNQLRTSYELGTITRDVFCYGYFDLLYYGTQHARNVADLPADQANLERCADRAVSLAVREVDLRVRNSQIKAAIKAVTQAYIEGRITRDEMVTRFIQAGISEARAEDHAITADWKKNASGRAPTMERLSQWHRQGLLNSGEYREELTFIGIDEADANRLVMQDERSIVLDVAKVEERLAKTTETAKAALQRQIKAIDQERVDAEKRLVKGSTQAQIVRWLSKEVISEGVARMRLKRLGIEPDTIDLIIEEVRHDQEKKAGTVRAEVDGTPNGPNPA